MVAVLYNQLRPGPRAAARLQQVRLAVRAIMQPASFLKETAQLAPVPREEPKRVVALAWMMTTRFCSLVGMTS